MKVVNVTRLMIKIFGIQRSGHKREELERIYRHHKDILQAVIDQDVERSRKLLSEHIQANARERLDEFDLWERENHLSNVDLTEALNLQLPTCLVVKQSVLCICRQKKIYMYYIELAGIAMVTILDKFIAHLDTMPTSWGIKIVPRLEE